MEWRRCIYDEQTFAGALLVVLSLCLCFAAVALADVSNAGDLKTALEAGGEITIGGNINVTGSLTVSKNTTIDMAGHTLTFSELGKDGSAFQVNKGVNLTIKNAGVLTTSDGNGRAIAADQGGSTVTLTGKSWSKSLQFVNFHSDGNGGAVLINGGSLDVKNVLFGKWAKTEMLTAQNGGAIYAVDSKILINLCQFYGCTAMQPFSSSEKNPDYGGGGLFVSGAKSNGTVKSSYFYDCRSANSGVSIHLDAVGGAFTVSNCRMMQGATSLPDSAGSRSSFGSDGGGIYVRICKNVTLSGNTISNNRVWGNGGGIMVIGDENTNVTLRNNTVSNNWAKYRGGGIKLELMSTSKVSLESGIISNNEAGVFGGGIAYTTHNMPTLVLKNVFISDNEAVRGAGIWCCPTSETEMYSTVGGLIVGNTAAGSVATGSKDDPYLDASGDDIRYEGTDCEDAFIEEAGQPKSETTIISVTRRAFNGIPIAWYSDETAQRYQNGDLAVDMADYQNRNTSFGLHGEVSSDLLTLAKEEALLVITGNKSGRGGGIASNSPIQIGEEMDITVTVIKQWAQDEHPEEIKVDLYRVDADGTRVKLDRDVVLNKENQWCATFKNLPAYTIDKAGKQSDYTYDVVEQSVNGWDCSSAREETDDGREITITLTNSKHIEVSPDEPEINVPSTGDSTPIMLWSLLALLSAAGIAVIVKHRAAQR